MIKHNNKANGNESVFLLLSCRHINTVRIMSSDKVIIFKYSIEEILFMQVLLIAS